MSTGITLEDIDARLLALQKQVEDLFAHQVVNADQIRVVQGLSDIDEALGMVMAGEFRAGNQILPGGGFTGMRMAYPSMLYGGEYWNLVGVQADVMQFGVRASDGKLVAGGGAVVIDASGIYAIGGTIGGWVLASDHIADLADTTGISSAVSGADDVRFWAGSSFASRATAPFRVTEAGLLTATGATITGSITATTGTIGGFVIGTDFIRDLANSMGLASTVSGGDDVRFWAGSTFANRATAPFRVTEAGVVTAVSGTIGGWVLSTTRLAGTGIELISGANAALAFGATVPVSKISGTGIWLDRTGLFGILGGVTQASFNATTGAITAGNGSVILDVNGIILGSGGGITPEHIKWASGGTTTGEIYTDSVFGTVLHVTTAVGEISLSAIDGSNSVSLLLRPNPSGGYDERLEVNAESLWVVSTSGAVGGIFLGTSVGSLAAVRLYNSGSDWRTPDGLTVDVGLNVGTASGAGTGEVRASNFVSQQLPFVSYAALPVALSVTTTVFFVSIHDACTIIDWSQTWFVATTNGLSDYWTMRIKRLDTGAIISTLDTSLGAANTWTRQTKTAINFAVTTGMLGLFVECVKTGAPGVLSMAGPTVFVQ